MTFNLAVSKFYPDVIVFLGDLLDEGSDIQSTVEFDGYVTRFKDIFQTKSEIKVNN